MYHPNMMQMSNGTTQIANETNALGHGHHTTTLFPKMPQRRVHEVEDHV
jgi:hypothetical protein